MDSITARIGREQGERIHNALKAAGIDRDVSWKTIISPHDDYAYTGYLYPAILKNLKAKTIILLGVAHKARQLGLEDQLIFDSFSFWKAPCGDVPVSP
ncbi:MAG TPA: AmmeMemoRadiSam system protein B, partial [Elusimicrobiales bacterium]|nr:AmmeMemoRadiSam system protein B [Elusimicrobiales bacterium]